MAKETKTQWHPAFCSAMKLELNEDSDYLNYYSEYNLNTKPLEIDLLIIKKVKEVELKNEIGKIFRKHNIVEYKSPKASLNLGTFLKVVAYACLYKTNEEHVDDIKLEEITITLAREAKPQKLFRWFAKSGYRITKPHPGIYYIEKENCFPTQILVSKELSKENQKWLTLLSSNLNKEDATRAAVQINSLTGESRKAHGDSVLQVAMKENENIFYEMKEEGGIMCQALREFFADEMKETIEALEAMEQKIAEQLQQINAQNQQLNKQNQQLNEQSLQLDAKELEIQELKRQLLLARSY